MKTTGTILKQAREAKGVSLNEVALTLKINSKILRNLEEGELDKLPAKTFLRGFVQSYAAYLKLDVDEILKNFYAEMGSTRPEEKPATESMNSASPGTGPVQITSMSTAIGDPNGETLGSGHKWSASTKIIFTTVLILLVISIIGIRRIVEKYERESQIENAMIENPNQVASPLVKETPSPTPVTGAVEKEAQGNHTVEVNAVTSNPSPAPNHSPVVTLTPTPSPSPHASVSPTASASPSSTVSSETHAAPKPGPNVTASPSPKPSPSPKAVSPGDAKGSQEVVIEALNKVEIEYFIDGTESAKINLAPGQVHSFKAKTNLRLKLSDGGSVNLFHNGQDKGVPGDIGKSVDLKFP